MTDGDSGQWRDARAAAWCGGDTSATSGGGNARSDGGIGNWIAAGDATRTRKLADERSNSGCAAANWPAAAAAHLRRSAGLTNRQQRRGGADERIGHGCGVLQAATAGEDAAAAEKRNSDNGGCDAVKKRGGALSTGRMMRDFDEIATTRWR
ncbi:hypothetical protein Scep_030853 [Stephania cephalantha]|uniref:Uncharacterized protein n=1 Tax=Stephania cephalantha TaxID=152367 RepID=A0AAP0E3V0_9MAGN